AQERRALCYRGVCPMDVPSSDAPLNSYTSTGGTLLFIFSWVVPTIRTRTQDLVPNGMLHSFNDAAHSLGAQPDAGQRGNLPGAHSLAKIEPEDGPITLPVRPAQAMLQLFIDLTQKELERNFLLTPVNFHPSLRIDVACRHVRLVPTRRLTMSMLEVIVSRIGGDSLQVSQDAFGILQGKVPQQAAPSFPKFEISYLKQILDQPMRWLSPRSGSVRDAQAYGLPHSRHELLPRLVIKSSGAKTNNLLERQRRVSCRCSRHASLKLI